MKTKRLILFAAGLIALAAAAAKPHFLGPKIEIGPNVTIWTRDQVWFLVREGINGKIEKLRYVPGNPPTAETVG